MVKNNAKAMAIVPCNIRVFLPSVNGSDSLPDTAQPGKDRKAERKSRQRQTPKESTKRLEGTCHKPMEALINIEVRTRRSK